MGWQNRHGYIKMSYFLPYGQSKTEIKFELDLCSYTAKSDIKSATVAIHRNFLKMLI